MRRGGMIVIGLGIGSVALLALWFRREPQPMGGPIAPPQPAPGARSSEPTRTIALRPLAEKARASNRSSPEVSSTELAASPRAPLDAPMPPVQAVADAFVMPDEGNAKQTAHEEDLPPGHPLWRLPPEQKRQHKLENEIESRRRILREEPQDPAVALRVEQWVEQVDEIRERLRGQGHVNADAELAKVKERFFATADETDQQAGEE